MLTAGTRLGPYEIVAPIGAGGMGEVFKARDTRLDRSVAIKVLPEALARDPEFKSRFEHEARAISSLNHPNICTLYDVGHENGTHYLVMELIEGESLAGRLSKGPLPFDQIVRYGAQIAEALDRAHRAGVIHRDLKPGNVMLTKSGAKLLDFGLAKTGGAPPTPAAYSGETHRMPITREGVVMGTFQYMAPEQIEGEAADARTDIFALGAVLYEMATGKRAFHGKTRTSLIAAIVSAEPPPISTIQPVTPPAFERVVSTCLRKDPEERWQNARDVALALKAISEESADRPPRTSKRAALPLLLAALAATAIAFALYFWRAATEKDAATPIRTLVLAPEKTTFEFRNYGAPPAISPDGTRIVFGAASQGKPRTLWIRPLDSLTAKELPGTEGAMFPFWSADSRLVGFFTDTSLKKIDTSGGSSLIVCPADDGRGGAWSPDGRTIVFGHRYSGLFRVAAGGGTPVQISKVDGTFASHRWPAFLPDGKSVLYLATPSGSEHRDNTVYMTTIDGKVQKPIVKATNEPHYLDGYLLVARDRILTAQRLDVRKMEVTGEPVSLSQQQIETASLLSRSMVSVSADGTLVYQTGEVALNTRLTWFDRAGKIVGAFGDDAPYQMVSIAPDAKTVAFTYATSVQPNIWLFDVARGVRTRLTFGDGPHYGPAFSPDSRNVAFYSRNPNALIRKNLQTGAEETVLSMPAPASAPSTLTWSPDSQTILYTDAGRATRSDLRWLSLAEGKSHTFLATNAVETNGRFSPDGKWVAYQSSESGLQQVYVAPFPPTGAKWQISTVGGVVPRWRADGKELFYVVPTSYDLMAVPISLGTSPQMGKPARLFALPIVVTSSAMYDVRGDGQQFLVNARIGDVPPPSPLIVVQNFMSELRQAVEQRD
jgi:Tol biopolymer transport system component